MMVELRGFQMFLLLFVVLEVTARTTHFLTILVRDGDEVILPCENVLSDHDNCDGTAWSFSQLAKMAAVDLVKGGRIIKRTDRLRITANCSLVMTNATKEDFGRYFCIQEKPGQRQDGEAVVDVDFVTMTEEKDSSTVILKCRLLTRGTCEHTVEWLFQGQHVDHKDLITHKLRCLATVTFKTNHFIYTSQKYELLKCNVKEKNSERSLQFTFHPPSSGRNKTVFGNIQTTTNPKELWWLFIIVPVGLTALLMTAVVIIRRKKSKGKITQMDENMPDPEDVSYVSISHIKRKRKAQVKHDDTYTAVIYSAVKTSSADDHSALYASVK
ncbi:uncharacterized protein [Labrus bergylta]|uniref:uncharacterized protein n=1 Tax=Labrus bergylta TaxID=56723 RepID=UPI0033138F38